MTRNIVNGLRYSGESFVDIFVIFFKCHQQSANLITLTVKEKFSLPVRMYFKYGKKISYTAPNRLKLVRFKIVSSDKYGCDFRATQSQSVFIKIIQYAISDYHNEH